MQVAHHFAELLDQAARGSHVAAYDVGHGELLRPRAQHQRHLGACRHRLTRDWSRGEHDSARHGGRLLADVADLEPRAPQGALGIVARHAVERRNGRPFLAVADVEHDLGPEVHPPAGHGILCQHRGARGVGRVPALA